MRWTGTRASSPCSDFQGFELKAARLASWQMRLEELTLRLVGGAECVHAKAHGHRAVHIPVIPCSLSDRRKARRP
jgi:hypothetical protein